MAGIHLGLHIPSDTVPSYPSFTIYNESGQLVHETDLMYYFMPAFEGFWCDWQCLTP